MAVAVREAVESATFSGKAAGKPFGKQLEMDSMSAPLAIAGGAYFLTQFPRHFRLTQ